MYVVVVLSSRLSRSGQHCSKLARPFGVRTEFQEIPYLRERVVPGDSGSINYCMYSCRSLPSPCRPGRLRPKDHSPWFSSRYCTHHRGTYICSILSSTDASPRESELLRGHSRQVEAQHALNEAGFTADRLQRGSSGVYLTSSSYRAPAYVSTLTRKMRCAS